MSHNIHNNGAMLDAAFCDFCDEFAGGRRNGFAQRYRDTLPTRIVGKTENFRIVPSLGQLSEGHLLLIPVEHYLSFAALPGPLLDEAELVWTEVRSQLEQRYGPTIIFEHGIRCPNSGGCGISHAHLHFVPFSGRDDIRETLSDSFPSHRINSLREVSRVLTRDCSYLLYADTQNQKFVFEVELIPSQFMRKLVAERIAKTDWDWRAYGQEPSLVATIENARMLR